MNLLAKAFLDAGVPLNDPASLYDLIQRAIERWFEDGKVHGVIETSNFADPQVLIVVGSSEQLMPIAAQVAAAAGLKKLPGIPEDPTGGASR